MMPLSDNVQELVAHAPIFGAVQPTTLESILEETHARLEDNPARHFICRKGQPVRNLSIIVSGWVMRYELLPDGRRQIVEFSFAGDVIGPLALASPQHHYFVQTITPVRRWVLDAECFAAAARKVPELNRRMTQLALSALAEREEMMTDLGRRTAQEKIARLILRLVARMDGAGMSRGSEYDFPFKQSHIADATGLTAVHVNRTLMCLRKENAINIENGKLTIKDLDVLLILAEMSLAEFRSLREKAAI